ncbi:MAG: hypothetical protein KDA89_06400 [Planctomycetaceae bacterium]|nr:hypothetical protein [Planctomycetaceae bacterium]
MHMTQRFLTLKEAQDFTGKSRSTLRRFVEGIVKGDDSPDRVFVLPTVDEVAQLKADNQPFSWKISTDLLSREFHAEAETSSAKNESRGVGDHDRLVTVLEKTVVVLQEELNEKNRQIAAFQERQREQNLLLKNLHEQLVLAAPKTARHEERVVESTPSTAEEGIGASQSPNAEPAAKRRSVWTRPIQIFGWKD